MFDILRQNMCITEFLIALRKLKTPNRFVCVANNKNNSSLLILKLFRACRMKER